MRLINWDYLEVLKDFSNDSIDCLITDPPYKTTSRWCTWTTWWMLLKDVNKKWQVFKHNNVNINDYAPEFYRVLKEWSHCYIMTNHTNLIDMLSIFTNSWFYFIKSLVWNKGNKIMGRFYMSQFEYILFFRKWFGKQIRNCWTSDILDIPNKKTKGLDWKNIHDTEKPITLMEVLIWNSSLEWEIVLDPFMWV